MSATLPSVLAAPVLEPTPVDAHRCGCHWRAAKVLEHSLSKSMAMPLSSDGMLCHSFSQTVLTLSLAGG